MRGVWLALIVAGCGRISFDSIECEPATQFVTLFAGEKHSCAVDAQGQAYCWGNNSSGALGDGTQVDRLAPVRTLLPKAISISPGSSFTCAIDPDHLAWCWGSNRNGQLGIGATTPSSTTSPMQVTLLGTVSDLQSGFLHVCALLPDGSVWCWGNNAQGQVGDGTTMSRPSPTRIPLPPADEISVSTRQHSCARVQGTVYCWGDNSDGQLGDGTKIDRTMPVQVMGITDAVEIAVGNQHSCARRASGVVSCWGRGDQGQLGTGNRTGSNLPVDVVLPEPLVDLDAGGGQTCGRTAGGKLICWGAGLFGQQAIGARGDVVAAAYVAGLTDVAAYSVGFDFLCAVHTDRSTECFGDNEVGVFGNGKLTSDGRPIDASGVTQAIDLVAADYTTCVASADGVRCFGDNSEGGLGDGSLRDSSTPLVVPMTQGLTRLAHGESGQHSCAFTPGGSALCWGRGSAGQLGDGAGLTSATPVTVALTQIQELAVGSTHSCAIRSDGSVACFGGNSFGQLGDGTTTARVSPTTIALTGATLISLGSQHSCAVAGGSLMCWGRNDDGELGTGTRAEEHAPVASVFTGTVRELALGTSWTCALDTGGVAWCWGGSGRTGTTAGPADVLVPAPALDRVTAIDAGDNHTCAVRDDGTVWCWGDCSRGRCGTSTTAIELLPVPVEGVTDAIDVSTGTVHTCVLRRSGAVACLGGNTLGELGRPPTATFDGQPICAP